MASGKFETLFGIGTIIDAGNAATAVVVNDQVCRLADIVARHSTPGAAAPQMRDFMPDWDRWHNWLRNLDLDPAKEEGWQPIDAVQFSAPVPEPWNIFQTYHNFDRPSRISGKVDPPKAERLLPDMFMASRSSLAGFGETIYREHGGYQFDFELEVTAIIGKPAFRVPAERADEYIAGYAIANDYTMHFSWWTKLREGRRTNDSIRMKNFPGYTPMSRVIVPRDLVGDPHDLGVKVTVDGVLRQDTRTNAMLWRVPELVEYLSHVMPLKPGDLIITGSPEELPLPPGEKKGLRNGQVVVCEVEKLGRLSNTIG
ncbi:unnamed protein product, partial [Phaeothamnion confervicola]